MRGLSQHFHLFSLLLSGPYAHRVRHTEVDVTDAGCDLRKTCAPYYDEHMPESSIEILGHSVGGITYRRYAHRSPLAFKAIMTLPQPSAFSALVKGFDGECPCCRRRFADAP
jgi:hypothetical protein